jgi:hypothetical protein
VDTYEQYNGLWVVENAFYEKYIVMQSRSKSPIVYQPVVSRLYTTTLHNNIIVEDFSAKQADSDSFPIHNDRPYWGQGSHMLFQALRASA